MSKAACEVTAIRPAEGLEGDNPLGGRTRLEMEAAGLSQSRAANEIGISASALSQWLGGTYRGDTAAVEGKVARWLDVRTERTRLARRLPEAPQWFETATGRRVLAALSYAQMATDLVVIYGGAGVGKTRAIERHQRISPNVWKVDCTPSSNTLGGFLRAVAFAVGVRVPKGHADVLEMALRDRLRGTGGLLVIDEAQFLNERALEASRRLAELSGIGLALCGNETVYAQLAGRNRAAEFAQLFSRIGKRVRLGRPARADVDAQLDAWGVTGREERDLVTDIARKPGALRMVTKVLRLATMLAQGDPLRVRHIEAAWRDLEEEKA